MTVKNLNQIDLNQLVKEQLEHSDIRKVSRYNYVKQISRLLRHERNQILDMRLIHTLENNNDTTIDEAQQSIDAYFIDFLKSCVQQKVSVPARDIKLRCPYCSGLATLTNSKYIYNGIDHGLIYLCENYGKHCDAYVAAHIGDNLPMGSLANKKTRMYRQLAHEKIDVLWKQYGFARTDVYNELSNYLQIKPNECHIGKFSPAQCEQVIKYASQIVS